MGLRKRCCLARGRRLVERAVEGRDWLRLVVVVAGAEVMGGQSSVPSHHCHETLPRLSELAGKLVLNQRPREQRPGVKYRPWLRAKRRLVPTSLEIAASCR
jgi:hypothetical protein